MKRFCLLVNILFCLSTYAFAQEGKVRLLFAGDAMQHITQIKAAQTKSGTYDYTSYFGLVKSQIEEADIAVVNLEVALGGKPYTGYPCFSAPDEYAVAIKDAGFDVFLTANNHCLDKGKKGLERTISQLDTLQVKHLGTYADKDQRELRYPMLLKKNGIRIVLLNYTYGTNGIEVKAPNIVNYIDKEQILKDIDTAKNMFADIIIANVHWGDEYKLYPNAGQKELANILIENGVNLVIGGHPHVVQPIDIRKEGNSVKQVVVYSMGNFISNMSAPNTDGGMMVTVDISKKENEPLKIDSCSYSLVWVNKPFVDGRKQYQLIPVSEYENEEIGVKQLGEVAYRKMLKFSGKAIEVVESMW